MMNKDRLTVLRLPNHGLLLHHSSRRSCAGHHQMSWSAHENYVDYRPTHLAEFQWAGMRIFSFGKFQRAADPTEMDEIKLGVVFPVRWAYELFWHAVLTIIQFWLDMAIKNLMLLKNVVCRTNIKSM